MSDEVSDLLAEAQEYYRKHYRPPDVLLVPLERWNAVMEAFAARLPADHEPIDHEKIDVVHMHTPAGLVKVVKSET